MCMYRETDSTWGLVISVILVIQGKSRKVHKHTFIPTNKPHKGLCFLSAQKAK